MKLALSVERQHAHKDPNKVAQVLENEKYTCAFCRLASMSYQDVIFPNTESQDAEYSVVGSDYNLPVVVDPLCKAVCEIDKLEGLGAIVHLPGVSQEDFNNMLRAILYTYFYSEEDSKKKEAANFLKEIFKLAIPVKEKLGTADPGKIGKVLKKISSECYELRENIVGELLFLAKPSFIKKEYSVDMLKDWFEKVSDIKMWQLNFDVLFGKRE